jgi:hypothetical protein
MCTHQSKMSSSTKIDLSRDFAAGVYQSLQIGDTFRAGMLVFFTQLRERLPL